MKKDIAVESKKITDHAISFLEITSAVSACGGPSNIVGCPRVTKEEEHVAHGHVRIQNGDKSATGDFAFVLNQHNKTLNAAIQKVLDHVSPQQLVAEIQKVKLSHHHTTKNST